MRKFLNKRTKLIATIGPSSDNYETLKELVLQGVTCIRTNFSHGSHEEHAKKFKLAKEISKELHIPISTMLDTKGPEIRVGKMLDGAQQISKDQILTIHTDLASYETLVGTSKDISVSYDMSVDLKEGDKVLFDDGKLVTFVTEVSKHTVKVKVENNHLLKSNKRINLPGVDFTLPFLAKKDIDDIIFGIEQKVDYIAASFVNSAKNVKELRQVLFDNNGEHIQIISKIESQLGIDNINEIIEVSDAIMIARGDLGLEVPYYNVPYYEKIIIRKCLEAGKPVIVATQMLDSMEKSPQPTRAEVTDVYYAVELGTSATMLSGESANGDFPVESVQVMTTISKRAEKEFYSKFYYPIYLELIRESNDITDPKSRAAISYNLARHVEDGQFEFAIVLSESGQLLRKVASFRPNVTIIGIVPDEKLYNSFGIYSSIFTSLDSKELFDLIKKDHKYAKQALIPYGVRKGDRYLIVENEKEPSEYTF